MTWGDSGGLALNTQGGAPAWGGSRGIYITSQWKKNVMVKNTSIFANFMNIDELLNITAILNG